MKILYAKCFGLGNACMSIPSIKALYAAGHTVNVLCGTLPDDCGAIDVFRYLEKDKIINKIFVNDALIEEHDLAILAIPYDGRWVNGVHFRSKEVVGGLTRPDPSTTGLVSWKKHEIEYQLEEVERVIGKKVENIDCSFYNKNYKNNSLPRIYYGVGYKKDQNDFWKAKCWHVLNFFNLTKLILNEYPEAEIFSTGNQLDYDLMLKVIKAADEKRVNVKISNFDEAFEVLSQCNLYVGNDTGMMHVAASMGITCIVPFFIKNSITKNKPWGEIHYSIDGNRKSTPEYIFELVKYFYGQQK